MITEEKAFWDNIGATLENERNGERFYFFKIKEASENLKAGFCMVMENVLETRSAWRRGV